MSFWEVLVAIATGIVLIGNAIKGIEAIWRAARKPKEIIDLNKEIEIKEEKERIRKEFQALFPEILEALNEKLMTIEEIQIKTDIMRESLMLLLRQQMLSIYNSAKVARRLYCYEKEKFDDLYKIYVDLGGNHYMAKINSRIQGFQVIYSYTQEDLLNYPNEIFDENEES